MRFLTAIRLGFHRLHRRSVVVVLAYLGALAPALLLAWLVRADLAPSLDSSLFAGRVFAGQRFAVWMDFLASPANQLPALFHGFGLRVLAVLLLQIAVSAGLAELLLGTTARGGHGFLVGIGRHGWRFLRAAVWLLLTLAIVAGILVAIFRAVDGHATATGNGTLRLYARLALAIVAVVAFGPLKLAYDLSRVAAAAHREGSTFRGYFRAFGHSVARPGLLLPLYLAFALLALAVHVAYFAARDLWTPSGPLFVALLFAAQQAILLLRAYLRGGLWASEIAYYQAIGEPRWCRRTVKKVKKEKGKTAPPQPAAESGGASTA